MPKRKPSKITCGVEGCSTPQVARKMCQMHYHRWRIKGDVMADIPPQGRAGSLNRPRVGDLILCVGCQNMLPSSEFAKRRSRCKPCQKAYASELSRQRRKPCADCGYPTYGETRCRPCSDVAQRKPPAPDRKFVTAEGYVLLKGYRDHPNAQARGTIFEHIKVMSEMIGRPLLPGENVHHKNGVRGDNRPENLELWIVNQPAGQRVEDLVAWAKEILDRYDAPADLRMVS